MKAPDAWLVFEQANNVLNSDPTLANAVNNARSNAEAAGRPQAPAVSTPQKTAVAPHLSRASPRAALCTQTLKMPRTAARHLPALRRLIQHRAHQDRVPVRTMDQGAHDRLHAVPDHGITAPVSTTEPHHPPAADQPPHSRVGWLCRPESATGGRQRWRSQPARSSLERQRPSTGGDQ